LLKVKRKDCSALRRPYNSGSPRTSRALRQHYEESREQYLRSSAKFHGWNPERPLNNTRPFRIQSSRCRSRRRLHV
jgi:hypothetical protein